MALQSFTTVKFFAASNRLFLWIGTKDMGERKIHMQKPVFKAMESLTLRMIGPHFLLYATEDIAAQYRR